MQKHKKSSRSGNAAATSVYRVLRCPKSDTRQRRYLKNVDLAGHIAYTEDVDAAGDVEADGLLGSIDAEGGHLHASDVVDLEGLAFCAIDVYLATFGLDGDFVSIDGLDLGRRCFNEPRIVSVDESRRCCTGCRGGGQHESGGEYVAVK